MKFWDSSTLIPLFIEQDDTKFHLSLLGEDPRVVAWWGSQVECASAFNRLLREGLIEQIAFKAFQYPRRFVDRDPAYEQASSAGDTPAARTSHARR